MELKIGNVPDVYIADTDFENKTDLASRLKQVFEEDSDKKYEIIAALVRIAIGGVGADRYDFYHLLAEGEIIVIEGEEPWEHR